MKKETYKKLLDIYQNATAFGTDPDAYRKYEKKTVDQHAHLCVSIKLFMRLEGLEEKFEKDTDKLIESPQKLYKVTFTTPKVVREHTDTFSDFDFAVQSAKEEILSFYKVTQTKNDEQRPEITFKVEEYQP